MERRLANKLDRHRREGVTYPNAGAISSLTPEQQRLELKFARHRAAQLLQEAEAAEAKPAEEPPAQTEKRGKKSEDKG